MNCKNFLLIVNCKFKASAPALVCANYVCDCPQNYYWSGATCGKYE